MKKLGDRNWTLISNGIKTLGTYNPDEILGLFIMSLRIDEVKEIENFLRWLHKSGKIMDHGNYETIFSEWKKTSVKIAETKKFYKTVIQIEVLSEEPFEYENLSQVVYQITKGGCSCTHKTIKACVLNGEEAAKALLAQKE